MHAGTNRSDGRARFAMTHAAARTGGVGQPKAFSPGLYAGPKSVAALQLSRLGLLSFVGPWKRRAVHGLVEAIALEAHEGELQHQLTARRHMKSMGALYGSSGWMIKSLSFSRYLLASLRLASSWNCKAKPERP